ncbi:MAG: hypothetical protein KDD72_15800, partial [Anaerolineales bacterium]|nr:hypothetical protein [Anaerolineales bacterium]
PMAIQFQQDHDWVKVRGACHQLGVETWERIHQLTGMNPLHPDPETWFAQMSVSSMPADTDIAALKTRLYDEYRIEIPILDWHGNKLMRLSVQGYNSRRDMDALINALKVLIKV